MTVVSFIAIHPKPGGNWEELQKQLKKGSDLARKHGAENVTALWNVAGGTVYGKIQDAMLADPEMQALMADPNSPIARWDTYVSQTIPDI
jgi:hypothetical protein